MSAHACIRRQTELIEKQGKDIVALVVAAKAVHDILIKHKNGDCSWWGQESIDAAFRLDVELKKFALKATAKEDGRRGSTGLGGK